MVKLLNYDTFTVLYFGVEDQIIESVLIASVRHLFINRLIIFKVSGNGGVILFICLFKLL